MINYTYIRQNFREAVHFLAVGSGDVRSRLIQANRALVHLKRVKIPDELQPDWDWIQKELNKFGSITRDDGSVFRGIS
ncbi:MAG: hypothetical protein HQ541_14210 [Mariniphaga sp.]|nr:hypothetical protein [Mariniphaga sp.]